MKVSHSLRRVLSIMMTISVLVMSFSATAAANSIYDELEELLSAVDEMRAEKLRQMIASLSGGNWADLESVMMAIHMEHANLLNEQMQQKLEEIRKRNEEIAWRHDMISKLKELKKFLSESPGTQISGEEARDMFGFTDVQMQELNEYTDGKDLDEVLVDEIITKLDEILIEISNTQQMDMLRLQSLVNRRNEALEAMRVFINMTQDVRSSIISNLR